MEDIRKLVRIQIFFVFIFILFKAIRPSILESNAPELFKLFLLSFPNFCEAVTGTLLLTAIGLYINTKFNLKNQLIYIMATIIAAIYVITQEVKIHNLGGNNVYDRNDVIFSIIGLLVAFLIIQILKPEIRANTNHSLGSE